jgi:hypothetical protein
MIHRKSGEYIMLPDEDFKLVDGDEILFCGMNHAETMIEWTISDPGVYNYILTGEEHPSGYLWRLVKRFRDKRSTSAAQA